MVIKENHWKKDNYTHSPKKQGKKQHPAIMVEGNQIGKTPLIKKTLSSKEKEKFLNTEKAKIVERGKKLTRFTNINLNTDHTNYKIIHLLHDPFTYENAYVKISKNRGALTQGYDDEKVMESFGRITATKIAEKIKKGEYKFKPVKRTWIEKPGKKSKRPIDVPTQADRIVQEAVRGILEAVYEPEFQKQEKSTKNLSNNYGFRPNKSTWQAIETLKKYSQRCNIVIEGDIVSAYNNVNHRILMDILQRRTKDKKFLNLMNEILKSGVMDGKVYEHSLIGTPQGGIVSPLLFNIYMLEFDKFIYDQFVEPILKDNESRVEKESKTYSMIRRQITNKVNKLKEIRKEKNTSHIEIKTTIKEIRKMIALRNKTPWADVNKLPKGAVYTRYADDWVLALTCNWEQAEQIKEKISEYLKTEKKMELDEEKTKITRASKGYTFLGFEIRSGTQKNIKQKRVLLKHKNGKFTRTLRRTTSRVITVEPDKKRILNRLKILQFCDRNYKPKAKAAWIVYDDFQIVEKYSQICRGIYNYYEPCGRLSPLSHIFYILQYSCAKTLARKKKISIRRIFLMYTTKLIIKKTILGTNKETEKKIQFLDIPTLRKEIKNPKEKRNDWDPFRIQEHWRTKAKLYHECCICGETEKIELHHINSLGALRKKGSKDKFEQIRSQINRLQIPICRACHIDITHGKYNRAKKPIEFYNEFLARL